MRNSFKAGYLTDIGKNLCICIGIADTKVIVMRRQRYESVGQTEHSATLQSRLTVLIVVAVLVVLCASTFVDYHRTYKQHINVTLASLEEQARALIVARSIITEQTEFAGYVDDFCAQMNEHISPGHHVLVLDKTGTVAIRTRHHSGPEVEEALLSFDPNNPIMFVDKHKLAQVRIEDKDGSIVIVAQYLDNMEKILRGQLVSRGFTTATTALAIILIIYFVLKTWVIKPVNNLATTAKQWAKRNFSARADPTGPADFRFLAYEFNSMSQQLQGHEQNRIAELEEAKQIQEKLLPASQPAISGLYITADYRPAEQVAGDLYDIFKLSHNRTCIAILDVCGHGISAALLTGVVKMSLHRRLAEKDNLSEAMSLVNDDIIACVPEGHFVTACVGLWDQEDQSWTYCAAGHPGGLLLTQNHAKSLEATAPLLGVFEGRDWPISSVKLSPGDRVFLYTDGVVESGLGEGEAEYYNLPNVLNCCVDSGLREQVATIMDGMTQRSSGRIKDDATIVAFEVLPKPALQPLSPVRH
jgi:HAMP domain-containing protein